MPLRSYFFSDRLPFTHQECWIPIQFIFFANWVIFPRKLVTHRMFCNVLFIIFYIFKLIVLSIWLLEKISTYSSQNSYIIFQYTLIVEMIILTTLYGSFLRVSFEYRVNLFPFLFIFHYNILVSAPAWWLINELKAFSDCSSFILDEYCKHNIFYQMMYKKKLRILCFY